MKTIEISDDLYEQIKEQLCDGNPPTEIASYADFIGHKLFIRTVTYHLIGKVVAVNGTLLELADASVVFDSGSLVTALTTGKLTTSEYVGKTWVNTAAVTDIFPWGHKLP